MKLINTAGMAFIGPGSEWFWTALTGLVLAATFLAIYRQLRLESSANAWEQLDAFERELASERMTRNKLAVLVAPRDGVNPAHVPYAAAQPIANFWEKIASLTRGGHIDPRLLRNGSGPDCQVWWAILAPCVRGQRAEETDPTIFEHFEWLAAVMDKLDRRMGVPTIVTEVWLARTLERRIAANFTRLREEQALRTVILQSPEAVTVEPPVATPATQAEAAPAAPPA
jgi:hypothetical protein